MPKSRPKSQNLPQKFNPISAGKNNNKTKNNRHKNQQQSLSSFLTTDTQSTDVILQNLKSPNSMQRESALLSLANAPSESSLTRLVTPQILKLLLEMMTHENELDMRALAMGILRNYLQDLYLFNLHEEEEVKMAEEQGNVAVGSSSSGAQVQNELLRQFQWKILLDNLQKLQQDTEAHAAQAATQGGGDATNSVKRAAVALESLRLIRVLCCIDLSSINNISSSVIDKFHQLLSNVSSSVVLNPEYHANITGGTGASFLWEALYIFFVWTDQNEEAARIMKSNTELLKRIEVIIKEAMPLQRQSRHRLLDDKQAPDAQMEDSEQEQQQNKSANSQTPQRYPTFLRIISLGIMYNMQNASLGDLSKLNNNTAASLLGLVSSAFDHIAVTLSELKPAQHLDQLVNRLAKEALSNNEAETIKEHWRLPVEGQKLSLELLANMVSMLAYEIASPPVSNHNSIQDESSVSSHYYNFVSQKNVLTHLFAYLSSMMQSYSRLTLDKMDFVMDQANLIHETFVSALGCMNNLILSTNQDQLKPQEKTFQSLFSGLCAYIQTNLPSDEGIKSALLEASTLVLWNMLRKLDDLDVSNDEATLACKLASYEHSSTVRKHAIGILHEVGARDHSMEQNHSLAEILLAKLSDDNVLVSIQCLNALFEIFGDDMYNQNVKALNMIAKLEIFANNVFMQKYKKQLAALDPEDVEFVKEAQENLNGFIAYKKQHM